MEEYTQLRKKDCDGSAQYHIEDIEDELRGEVSIRSNEAADHPVYAFKPLPEDSPRTRRVCECKGKKDCMSCGGKGFFYEIKIQQIYVADEGWI